MAAEFDEMWELLLAGSEEQAFELGVDSFDPPALDAADEWLASQDGALDEEEAARLGLFLARVLIETHGGGLTRIQPADHPLHGEWAVTGFTRGLAPDYHVPFLISAQRIAEDRSLGAAEWYRQLLREGR